MLQFCVSQQPNETPYQFKATGIRVYSLEEALYHVFHYWKQSVDDILSDEMIAWVGDTLGLSYMAAHIKELTHEASFNQRMQSFLRLTEYFDDGELSSLSQEMVQWERQREWVKLKERADYLMERAEPEKALPLYRKALQYEENTALLNNIGVAWLRLGVYENAIKHFEKALETEPEDKLPLMLRYAEAAAYAGRTEVAEQALSAAANLDASDPDISYLRGVLAFEQGNYPAAVKHFEDALTASEWKIPLYAYRLSDCYSRMRQYEKALSVLNRVSHKDTGFHSKQAELHAAAGNLPAAAKAVQVALISQPASTDLWVKLAKYYRMDYDLPKAEAAITKALSLDAENERARLENARIKKALGRTREYQGILNQVLTGFRQRYREVQ
jgi:tetratricopeptide (TPR) repeat protein